MNLRFAKKKTYRIYITRQSNSALDHRKILKVIKISLDWTCWKNFSWQDTHSYETSDSNVEAIQRYIEEEVYKLRGSGLEPNGKHWEMEANTLPAERICGRRQKDDDSCWCLSVAVCFRIWLQFTGWLSPPSTSTRTIFPGTSLTWRESSKPRFPEPEVNLPKPLIP